jgi:hypothetical protein
MKHLALATAVAVSILLAGCGGGHSGAGGASVNPQTSNGNIPQTSANDPIGFGFNGSASGISGAVMLTGGGAYDPATASNTVPSETTFAHTAGGFSCTQTVSAPPLAGCLAGQGVRWDTAQLLESTPFKCTPADPVHVATTGTHTVVLLADFYRAGDGNHESFTAKMIVSDTDLNPDLSGAQNLWIQGVGCGPAIVHFSS